MKSERRVGLATLPGAGPFEFTLGVRKTHGERCGEARQQSNPNPHGHTSRAAGARGQPRRRRLIDRSSSSMASCTSGGCAFDEASSFECQRTGLTDAAQELTGRDTQATRQRQDCTERRIALAVLDGPDVVRRQR